ncbi:nucleotidyl transferase AbiEii/AbiGii toxin family protein [Hydrogenivirga sp. 128-5-R1-1]|uniref:nucleotidyl transferase AbiEii/AbiGii toxin family protein n=1 Tax=Hydrogenivirga sp. 128-5-R1-1 TaxID=392423 RepID=UPI001E5DD6EF|nr:nucleotidyl transferase AbiEii/AbiGii toxin family protein [Hydrogenivirga sp. 128-5-R1-1]
MIGRLERTLEKLTRSGITEGFYLAGGTAVAIKYGHRRSEDFDFFAFPDRQINLNKITALLGNEARWITADEETAIFIHLPENVKTSFFVYPYPLLEKPGFHEELRIFIASDIDTTCMKAIAIAQRGSKKDFYDLWYLMQKHGWTLNDLENALKRKVPSWSFGIFLRSLTYFENAEKESYPGIDERWEEVKEFFKGLVNVRRKKRQRRGNRPTL